MSNTYLRAASALSLVLGIVLTLGNSVTILQANLSGQGSTVLPFHGAALPVDPLHAQAQMQLFIGMLLIILGFLFYALSSVRHPEHSVRVRAVPSRRAEAEATRMKRRRLGYYWVEIKI